VGMIKAEVGRKRGRDLFVARLRVGKASGKRRQRGENTYLNVTCDCLIRLKSWDAEPRRPMYI
jgi:hypothetical protein